jgi:hypothetical protein
MRIGKLPLLAARFFVAGTLLVAGTFALGATMAAAQGKADDNPTGATGDPPQSRGPEKELPPLSLLPKPDDELEGGEDDVQGGHTCPDRGNNLELII